MSLLTVSFILLLSYLSILVFHVLSKYNEFFLHIFSLVINLDSLSLIDLICSVLSFSLLLSFLVVSLTVLDLDLLAVSTFSHCSTDLQALFQA